MRIEVVDGALRDGPHWQASVIMAMPALDEGIARRCAELMARRAGDTPDGLVLVLLDHAREGYIRLVNRAFARCRCDYFGYVAEDAFAGRGWLQLALLALRQRQAKLLAFNDGKWLGKMASFGLAEHAWAASLYDGDFFHPAYRQHYADYELSRIAQHQRVFAFEPASVLLEVDWEKDGKRPDQDDKALFRSREASGFGGLIQP